MIAELFKALIFSRTDPRRRQELKDARMIQEDPSAIANLSPKPLHHEFNQQSFNQNPMTDDEVEATPKRRRKKNG